MPIGVSYISVTLVILLLFCIGIGLSLAKLLGLEDSKPDKTLSAFWIGWSFVIISLQIWHLLAPVDIKVFIVFAIVSLLCLISLLSGTLIE
jgi:hypothetical protein